ncbi:MAG: hypothetical protein Crog4KO_02500 [Crocinitomicaceae bacterium]
MKNLAWIKHGITLFTLGALIVGLIQIFSLNVESENFGNNILSATFFLFVFVVLGVYRINWIGRSKIDVIATILTLTTLTLLLTMLTSPKNVMALWKPSIAVFIVLAGYTFYRKLDRKNWGRILSRTLLVVTCLLFLYPLLIKTGDALFYTISWYFLAATTVFAIVSTVLPEKQR